MSRIDKHCHCKHHKSHGKRRHEGAEKKKEAERPPEPRYEDTLDRSFLPAFSHLMSSEF